MPILTLRRRQRRNNALAFGLSLLLVLAVYALLGFAPFGDGTLLTGDLNGLYVNYITDMWRRVRQGGFFYSFAKLCGGSTLGLFAYYMNSPFNLLYLLFPVRAIPWVVQLVFALRTACTGAACCFLLQRHTGSAGRLLPFLSLGYSLCAFCVVYSQNILWMDVVMLAPLLLWAVEALAETGRHWPLTLLVFACTLFNFYTAWAVCLFSVLYFFWFWLRRPRAGGLLRRLGLFAGSGALGAGLALGLLLPALLEVEQSKGSLFALDFSLSPNYPLWQLPYRLFFGNFFWSDVTGTLPNLYCGTVTAALVLLFFTGARPRREKLAAGALLALLALCSWVRGLDLVWHGFKEPVWFPCRYSFLISLFLVLLAALALAGPPPSRRALAWAAALGAIWCAGYPLAAGQNASACKLAAAGALLLGTLAAAALRGRGAGARRAAAVLLALLLAGDLGANTVLALRKFESYTRSGFEQFYDRNTEAVAAIRAQDDGACRIEKNFRRTLNDPMLLGYWGISHYSSTKASSAKELLESLGYVNSSIYGWGSTGVADSLLGIRYLYSDGSRPVPGHYRPLDTGTELAVYENPAALPLAYTASSGALAVETAGSTDTFALQNEMLTALAPGADAPLQPAAITFLEGDQGITLRFTTACAGPCYLAIPGTDEALPADVRVDGTLLGEYFTLDSMGGVMPLGTFAAGQTVELYLGFADSAAARAAIQVCSLDETALAEAAAWLQAGAPEDLTIREGGTIELTAVGTAEKDLLVLSFAWEDADHWELTVNGEPAELEAVFGGLMGVRLEPGEQQIRLRYRHPGVPAGLAGSALSLLAAAGWAVWEHRRRGGRPQRREEPI